MVEVGIVVPEATSARTLVQQLFNVFHAGLGDRSYTLVGRTKGNRVDAGALS